MAPTSDPYRDLGGEAFASEPWWNTLVDMGIEPSRVVWHLDPEGFENDDDYVWLLESIALLGEGRFALANIAVSLEEGWVSFHLNGRPFEFEVMSDGDWLDTEFFSRVNDLLERSGYPFLWAMPGSGQDVVLLFLDGVRAQEFSTRTRMRLDRL